MRRSSRLFEIIQVLRSAPAPITAEEIARALEVTKRTVYRDIVTLQAMRVPIEGEAGIGYVMRAGFNLPPLMFTEDEIEAIVVGLSLIGRTGDAGLRRSAAKVTQKIASVLPEARGDPFRSGTLQVSQWTAIPSSDIDFQLLRAAIREERKLRLTYESGDGRVTDRTVCPVALVYYIESVILAAWCEFRADYRHFRIDRMQTCILTEASFQGNGVKLRADWRARHQLFS